MPTIRALVKAFDYPGAAPHIYTGVETIIPLLARMSAAAAETPSKRPRRSAQTSATEMTETRILSLIAVIFLYVSTRMKDVDVSPQQYNEWRETAVNTLLALPAGENISYEELSLTTEEMMPLAQAEGWLRMEWFLNVSPEGDGEGMEGIESSGETSRAIAGNLGTRSGGSDYIGLGTMMQDATDYLGERQRGDYEQWKTQILARVQELETV